MTTRELLRCAVPVARYYLRPLRRSLTTFRQCEGRTWNVVLGPVRVCGHDVVLRTPRVADAAEWRAARLRERRRIEPWWASDPRSWAERHTDAAWVTGWLQARQQARAGHAFPLIIEVDGQVAGECGLAWIAPHTATAEMSAWLEAGWGALGVSGVAGGLLLDHATSVLGVQRVIAPIAAGNRAAAWAVVRLGLRKEGRMAGYLEVGGRRLDHDLWAITAEQLPEGGLAEAMRAAAENAPRTRGARVTPAESAGTPAPAPSGSP
ncbi:GNAT family N-acetyltransferase [Pseudonocardia sp. CA-107938]|uniref:GNAT family N-acetyltransferase n=1 Tax=Pseudonocardia sp. CA-107938 TaxID=3240021 RepID=UPI003D93C075